MSCPKCDHTMHNLDGASNPLFWCPRCGTVRTTTEGVVGIPRWIEELPHLQIGEQGKIIEPPMSEFATFTVDSTTARAINMLCGDMRTGAAEVIARGVGILASAVNAVKR